MYFFYLDLFQFEMYLQCRWLFAWRLLLDACSAKLPHVTSTFTTLQAEPYSHASIGWDHNCFHMNILGTWLGSESSCNLRDWPTQDVISLVAFFVTPRGRCGCSLTCLQVTTRYGCYCTNDNISCPDSLSGVLYFITEVVIFCILSLFFISNSAFSFLVATHLRKSTGDVCFLFFHRLGPQLFPHEHLGHLTWIWEQLQFERLTNPGCYKLGRLLCYATWTVWLQSDLSAGHH